MSDEVVRYVEQLASAKGVAEADAIAAQLVAVACDGLVLRAEAPAVMTTLADALPGATSAGGDAAWQALGTVARASVPLALSDPVVLQQVRDVIVAKVVPQALPLVGGEQTGRRVWAAVDVADAALSFMESDPRPVAKALKAFGSRGPDEAARVSNWIPMSSKRGFIQRLRAG